jgi:DNA-binding protein H-NS
MTTLDELLAQQKTLQQQIEQLRASERKNVIKEIRALVDKYALTADDLFSAKKKRGQRQAAEQSALMYQDPATSKTWNGHGRAPGWIKGKNYDDFRI